MSALTEQYLAILDGEAGPGITAWVSGVRFPCCCGHGRGRHGEGAGAGCGFLTCDCTEFRPALAVRTTEKGTTEC